jgi:hypothetical protein
MSQRRPTQLGGAQTVAVGDQDHGRVAVAVATGPIPGGGDQPLDLVGGEVLARPAGGVGNAPWRYIPIYEHWRGLVYPRLTLVSLAPL